jgi:uncharacterized protein (DUF305 family)
MRSRDPGVAGRPAHQCATSHVGFILALALITVGTAAPEGRHVQHAMDTGNQAAPSSPAQVSTVKPFGMLMDEAMVKMDDAMKGAPMTGDPDHDFAAMMIPHHQGAIDMAKAELLYGRDPILRRLAQEILVTQMSEITVMQGELKKQANSGGLQR